MQFLAIFAQNPSPTVPQAGHKLAFCFLKELAAHGRVDLVLLLNSTDVIDKQALEELGVRLVWVIRFTPLAKLLAIVANIFKIPPRFSTRYSVKTARKIGLLCKNNNYDEVYFEFSQSFPYVERCSGLRASASIHDVQLQVVLRSGWLERTIFSAVTYSYERKILPRFNKTYLLCDKDKALINGLYLVRNSEIRSPKIQDYLSNVERSIEKIERYSMLFWGAMNRLENYQSALYFVEQIFPEVRRAIPEAKLYIVGNEPPKKVKDLASKSVIVTGYVENPKSYFERAHIGVVPLLRGAGIKIKTLEMLSTGLSVVSTEIGAEGVSHTDDLNIVDLENFAASIIKVLRGEPIVQSQHEKTGVTSCDK